MFLCSRCSRLTIENFFAVWAGPTMSWWFAMLYNGAMAALMLALMFRSLAVVIWGLTIVILLNAFVKAIPPRQDVQSTQ